MKRLAALTALLLGCLPAAAQSARVALTFDDLPEHGPLVAGVTRIEIARRILAALARAGAPPAYGFVNGKDIVDDPGTTAVLRAWVASGNLLGNHTYSHMDLNTHTAAEFEADVAAGEAALEPFMGSRDWRWLRFPYLNEGETPEKRAAVRSYLAARRYRVAQVTIDFKDWAYNEPYARCVASKDTAAIAWLRASYREQALWQTVAAQRLAKKLFGRDVAHVMLLHIGVFESVMLPELTDLLAQQGFSLVSLEAAQADPVYAQDPGQAVDWGASLLEQWRYARHMPLEPADEDVLKQLDAICR